FARLSVNTEWPTTGCVWITPLTKTKLEARSCDSFQPSVDSARNPMRRFRLERNFTWSWTNHAASRERQPTGVGEGTTVKVPTVPFRKFVKLPNDAWPY